MVRDRARGVVLAAAMGALAAACAATPGPRPEKSERPQTSTLPDAPASDASHRPTDDPPPPGELDLDEEDSEETPAIGQMTEEAAQAKRLFDSERWEEATLALKRVSDGETGDDEGNKELAQYRLAVALFNLKYYQTSYAVFAAIADKTAHVKHAETLLWLARLATMLPEPADVVERVGKYQPKHLSRFDNPQQRELFAQLNLMLGRYKIRNRDYEGALKVLANIDAKSAYFATAQLAMGAAEHGLRKPERAAAAFVRAEGISGDGADAAQKRNLAHLLRGSALFVAAAQADGAKLDAKSVAPAVKAWQDVEPGSEYWIDASLELASASIAAGDYDKGLRAVRWLRAAGVPAAIDFELDALDAAVSFQLCRWDEADAAVAQMTKKWAPVKKELDALLERPAFKGDDAERGFFDFEKQVRAGSATLAASIKPSVELALSDRQIGAQIAYLGVLGEEEARLKKAPPGFRSSPLGADVSDVVALGQEIVVRNAGALGLDRVRRLALELDPANAPLLKTIRGAGKAEAERKAARARLAAQLAQHGTRYLTATSDLSGKGKKPAAPKSEPGVASPASKCGP